MNPFKFLKTVPSFYIAKPKVLYFFSALEVLIALIVIFSLLQTASGYTALLSSLNLFSLTGALFLLLGSGFFVAAHGVGWSLLFVGHMCFILQLITHFLMRNSVENFSIFKTLTYSLVHISLLRFLFYPFIYKLFSSGKNRHWIRASRVSCLINGEIFFLGRKSKAVLINISETGCLFECEDEVPIEEIVKFSPANEKIMPFEICVQRQFGEKNDDKIAQYGGQFLKKFKSGHLRHLLTEQTQQT